MLNKIFERLDGIFCDPEGKPCFQGSEVDRQEYINIRNAALTQPKADVDTLMKDVYAAYENDDDSHKKSTVAWVIDHLAAQGYIGGAEWQPIDTAPRDGTRILVCDGYEVTDAYFNKGEWWRYECGDDWYSSSINPTHWMPLPAAPKKEGDSFDPTRGTTYDINEE